MSENQSLFLSMRFDELASMTGGRVQLSVNVVGVCDHNPDCLHFCEVNHKPRYLHSCFWRVSRVRP